MKTDFEIAHEAKLELIDSIAKKVELSQRTNLSVWKVYSKSALQTY